MQLSTYLATQKISDPDFAALIGVNRSTVHRMRNGKLTPSPTVMRAIADKTDNAVTPNDFLGVEPQQAAA
jgi:DNA-binding XRE family transcriptional regulator